MPRKKKTDLRGFLKKYVLQNRLELDPASKRSKSKLVLDYSPTNSLIPGTFATDDKPPGGDNTKSVFSEERQSESQRPQTRLEQFLNKPSPGSSETEPKSLDVEVSNTRLKHARKQLALLLTRKHDLGEKDYRRQREGLIEFIRRLESEEKLRERERLKSLAQKLPEPVAPWEKKNLAQAAKRASRAVAGLELTVKNKKRSREEEDSDDNLDGEERLRYGKRLEAPATEISGHWRATIHDYFPEDSEERATFDDMTPEDKLLFRRQIADLAEQAAKVDRAKKLSEWN